MKGNRSKLLVLLYPAYGLLFSTSALDSLSDPELIAPETAAVKSKKIVFVNDRGDRKIISCQF